MAELALDSHNLGDHRITQPDNERPTIKVPTVTMDALLRQNPEIDLVKIDTQGAEPLILLGGAEAFRLGGDRLTVVFEFWPGGLRRCAVGAEPLFEAVRCFGGAIYVIDGYPETIRPSSLAEMREYYDKHIASGSDAFSNVVLSRRGDISQIVEQALYLLNPTVAQAAKPTVSFFGEGEERFGAPLSRFCGEFRNRGHRLTELCRMMAHENSDKGGAGGWHNYTLLYDHLFGETRQSIRNVFELGVDTGASLRAWRSYFPNATVYGGDVDAARLFSEERIATFHVDQTRPESIAHLWEGLPDVEFDLIVDDGAHFLEANSTFLLNSWHKLSADGVYVIEDIVVESANQAAFRRLLSNLPLHGFLIQLPHARNGYDNCVAVLRRGAEVRMPSGDRRRSVASADIGRTGLSFSDNSVIRISRQSPA
jgi:hypothetical protein